MDKPEKPAKQGRPWGWIIGGVMVGSVAFQVYLQNAEPADLSKVSQPKAEPLSPKRATIAALKFDYEANKGGFGRVMILSGSIKNPTAFRVKDPTITCNVFAASGTALGELEKVLYQAIPPGKVLRFSDLNMGLQPDQVATFNCSVTNTGCPTALTTEC